MYRHRRAVASRFGKVFALPIAKRVREVVFAEITSSSRVLEVGAGDRRLAEQLAQHDPSVVYESLDIDPVGRHDYHDLAEIDCCFGCIFAFEVVEHLDLSEIIPWLTRLAALLEPGGTLVLSTPNTYYPPAFLRDATHRTPLCYDELGGLVEAAGLRVERITRIYHDPIHRMLLRRVLFGWLFRMIGIDFARQIVLVARKPTARA